MSEQERKLDREKKIREAEDSTVNTLLFGLVVGAVGLIGYPLTINGIGCRLLFVGLLMAAAAFITGFFTGILFGIPKRNNGGDGDYSLNNNLVDIADWLTKIIVGLGLVNLQNIPGKLLKLGTIVQDASGSIKGQSLDIFAMCAVVYFSVLGLYIGYNYMRLVLSSKYKDADDNLLERERDEALKSAEEATAKAEEQRKTAEEQRAKAEAALAAKQENDDFWYKFQDAVNAKTPEEGIELYGEAISIKPNRAISYYNRGCSLSEAGKYIEAIEDFSKAYELSENEEDAADMKCAALLNRGTCYKELRDYDKAINDNSKVIELDSTNTDAYYNRALVYLDTNRYQEAISDFTTFLTKVPDSADGFIYRAEVYRKMGDFERAQLDINKAEVLEPDNSYINASRAEICAVQGNAAEFYRLLKIALDQGFPVWDFLEDPAYTNYKDESQFKELIDKYKPEE